ncbi:MAG: TerD family protein, partial [Xenococcus sp. (in: cyanobacteria)]
METILAKGEVISLEKVAPGITEILIGLGWDINSTCINADFDLDASLFILGSDEKLLSDKHFIFYNNLISPDPNKSIRHLGDNLTGSGDGDNERLKINLQQVPSEANKIVVTVTIHESEKRQQNFGQVQNSFVRILNAQNKQEIVRYNLTEDYNSETALIIAEIYRQDNEWYVCAVGSGYKRSLQDLSLIHI